MGWTCDKHILAVAPCGDGLIVMDWSDGTRRVFDMHPHMHGPALERLADPDYFNKVFLQGRGFTVRWPQGEDFAPETLYEQSEIVDASGPLPPKDPSLTWNFDKRITEVVPQNEGLVCLGWSDGTRRVFDVWAWADTDAIEKLLDPSYYRQVAVGENGESIVWPGGQGFSAKTMYENSFPVDRDQASRFISFS